MAHPATPNDPAHAASRCGQALIVGCGYLGLRVARQLIAEGWQVAATTRKPSRHHELREQGIEPITADWTDRRSLRGLPPHQRMLVAVAYDRHSQSGRYASQVLGFRNLLEATDPAADLCYISTTGVYHQDDGRWVDETSPCHPARESGRVHLEAEQLLPVHRRGGAWSVLRLAGIYGPQRIPRVQDVVAGRPIDSPADSYLNLIHVQDAAAAVMAAWRLGPTGSEPRPADSSGGKPKRAGLVQRRRYYVVSDGVPVRRADFYQEIARITGSPPPQFQSSSQFQQSSQLRQSGALAPSSHRSGSNKRIWNARMQKDLLPRLQFPSYKEGLRSILNHESSTESTT